MEARFITDLSKLVSESQQQILQRLLYVDQRLSQQTKALGEVMGATLPLMRSISLSDKTRSREINALFSNAQLDLEILFTDMAFLSETLDRLSTLSDATIRTLDVEAARIAATLAQYRAKLFGVSAGKDVFRHVSAMTHDNLQAKADADRLLDHAIDPTRILALRSPGSFDADLMGYTLAAASSPINPGDFTLEVTKGHPNALPGDLSLAVDPKPESAWKETLMVDAPLSGGAQCDLTITFATNPSLGKLVLDPFNRTAVIETKAYVTPSQAEEGEPFYRGYPLQRDDLGFFVKPPELQNLSEETRVVLLDRAITVRKLQLRLAQLRYTTRSVALKIQGLKDVPTALDGERLLHDPQWSDLLAAEQGKKAISLNKYEYLYGLKDLRFYSVSYNPMARFISDPVIVDQPISSLYLSTTERTVWRRYGLGPFSLYDEASQSFADELPLEALIDYRVRVLNEDMLDDPDLYRLGLEGAAGEWAPMPILPQEQRTRYGEWLYDWLHFERADALSIDGQLGAWVAPLATRPLDWASDPFGTTLPNAEITAALYRDGFLVRRGASGRVDQFRFLTTDETYGLHVAIPYAVIPTTMDIGAMRFVAAYRPDSDYLDSQLTPLVPAQKFGAEVFTTSRAVALADADQSAISASAAQLVEANVSELKLKHKVALNSQPIVTRRLADGSYRALFQQTDPTNPNLYRTAHAQVSLESLRFNGRPLRDVFGTEGEQDPLDGHVTLDLSAHPEGGSLTYLYGPPGTIMKSATEIASVRRDFTLDGDRLILREALKSGELLKINYVYYRYALVLDARLQRLGMDTSVTPSLTSFGLGGTIA